MAPEQIHDPHRVDGRCDVYALGVLLYEVLTDELPRGRFDPPSVKVEDTRLDSIVFKALAADPDARYPTATEMNQDLGKIREKSFRMALLTDLALFSGYCLPLLVLVASAICRIDLSTVLWPAAFLWLGLVDDPVWVVPRLRWVSRWTAFAGCLGINLAGPLLGGERLEGISPTRDSPTGLLFLLGWWVFCYSILIGGRAALVPRATQNAGWWAFGVAFGIGVVGWIAVLVATGYAEFLPWGALVVTLCGLGYVAVGDWYLGLLADRH